MSHGLGEAPDPLDGEPGASATGESTRPRKCEELPRSVGIWIETDTKFSLVVHEAVSGRLDNLSESVVPDQRTRQLFRSPLPHGGVRQGHGKGGDLLHDLPGS